MKIHLKGILVLPYNKTLAMQRIQGYIFDNYILIFLIKSGGGTGPMKPGNLKVFNS